MLLATTEYRERCSPEVNLLGGKEHEKYNWMLGAGAFELFEYHGDLWEWHDEAEFEDAVEGVLGEILS